MKSLFGDLEVANALIGKIDQPYEEINSQSTMKI
jgi:hypothetical protein